MNKNKRYARWLIALALGIGLCAAMQLWSQQRIWAQNTPPPPPADTLEGQEGPPPPPLNAPQELENLPPPPPLDAPEGHEGDPPAPPLANAYPEQGGPPRPFHPPYRAGGSFHGRESWRGYGPPPPPYSDTSSDRFGAPDHRDGFGDRQYAQRSGPQRGHHGPDGQCRGPQRAFDRPRGPWGGPAHEWNGPQGTRDGESRMPFGPPDRDRRPDPDALFTRIDANSDGMISKDEFRGFHERQRPPHPPRDQRPDTWNTEVPPEPDPMSVPVPPPTPGSAG